MVNLKVMNPQVIVYPPQEEKLNEPCISYPPNDFLQGLPNPHNSKPRSALNALLQAFTTLPDLNEELPVASPYAAVSDFVCTVLQLHGNPVSDDVPSPRVASADSLELEWWRSASRVPHDDSPDARHTLPHESVDSILSTLFDDVLLLTRFGQRFQIGLVHGPHPDCVPERAGRVGDRNAHVDTDGDSTHEEGVENGTTEGAKENGTTQNGSKRAKSNHETAKFLKISLAQYSRNDCVTLLSLLNDHLGHAVATFFFGGAFNNRSLMKSQLPTPPTSSSSTSSPSSHSSFHPPTGRPLTPPTPRPPPRKTQTRITVLPHFFTIYFQRPLDPTTPQTYHNTPVELPTEVDLGFYLSNRQSDQKTFYRLHGFVTQTEGHFLTYTRLRGLPQWYRCDDDKVVKVELGPRVESRGVVLVIYRLQAGGTPN
ncbi:uncharacterized protein EV422DRAFT_533210 [Fimicolochytrium jonesii]|uniref:uncharacterized protein n=1 Tax=Fimicolochytrium jonesii TaxID=1396493 RepID=UPI0022FDDB72|nr:uncharacterized protein EV422DRAFT_533210 [Fimicolochytrium jonesii]KAI8820012.1 hypothetical protein EV422DRAFT_533210 [Fimicolochytrium jonesii]